MLVERVPPNDLEAEQVCLACCFVSPVAAATVTGRLGEDDFYHMANKAVVRAIKACQISGTPVDTFTIRGHLLGALDGLGGYGYIIDLASSFPTVDYVEFYIDRVEKLALRRRAIEGGTAALIAAYDEGQADWASLFQTAALATVSGREVSTVVEFGDVVSAAVDGIGTGRIDNRYVTGWYDLDQIVTIEPPNLIVIGARPSVGKTALGLNLAWKFALEMPVLFFSLEMSAKELAARWISHEIGVSKSRQASGMIYRHEREHLGDAVVKPAQMKLTVDDASSLTVGQIRARTMRRALIGPVGLVVVDYLQRMAPTNSRAGRVEQVSEMSKGLKDLAKDVGCPVVVLAQLNRQSEGRDSGKPRLSDLRDSGSIEQDADVVLLLHREDRHAGKYEEKPLVDVLVPKNRMGACGEIQLRFDAMRCRFDSVADGTPV